MMAYQVYLEQRAIQGLQENLEDQDPGESQVNPATMVSLENQDYRDQRETWVIQEDQVKKVVTVNQEDQE
jgi:hypothetical protein